MDSYEVLRTELIRLHKKYPNNMELGNQVRSLIWKMMEERSKKISDENLPGQINIFGEIKK
jgi:hypothetical protein